MSTLAPPSTQQVREIVGDDIFGATFTKADGSTRTGSFRLGAAVGLTGQGLAYDPEARGNLIVFDMNRKGYRTIKMERLISIRAHGETFEFGGDR